MPLAQAQVVGDCEPGQYLNRTAAGADRELSWDFSISEDPERCLEVKVGQTVVWNGDLDTHPLAGRGGDSPNPISLHQNGAVTFQNAGTFGFVCLSHSPMKGAIHVVATPPLVAAVPAISPALVAALMLVLLGLGWDIIRSSRARPA